MSSTPRQNPTEPSESGIDILLRAFGQAYFHFFQQRETPLHFVVRFLCAAFGSFTFFATAFFFNPLSADNETATQAPNETSQTNIAESAATALSVNPLLATAFWFYAGIMIFAFALLVSASRTNHGHIRFYFQGVFVPALSVVIVRTAWSA